MIFLLSYSGLPSAYTFSICSTVKEKRKKGDFCLFLAKIGLSEILCDRKKRLLCFKVLVHIPLELLCETSQTSDSELITDL